MLSRKWNLEEINVWRKKYDDKISAHELIINLIIPFVALYFMSNILYHYTWLSITLGIVGSLYIFWFSLPALARRSYRMRSLQERDRFINLFSQSTEDPDRPFIKCLIDVSNNLKGELKIELSKLAAKLQHASNSKKVILITKLKEKYADDVALAHLFEQMITMCVYGNVSKRTLNEIAAQHNEMLMKRRNFINKKLAPRSEIVVVTVLCYFVLYTLTNQYGIPTYLKLYAHQPSGWIFNTIHLLILGVVYRLYSVFYLDDEIEEVKMGA